MEELNYEEPSYEENLIRFKEEVKSLNESSFKNVENWRISKNLLNGVIIGYSMKDRCARKLLHYVGLKHDLNVLCPNDIVDLEVRNGIRGSIIRTEFGNLSIKQNYKSIVS